MPVYLITYLILFWIPVIALAFYTWPSAGKYTRKALLITLAIMIVLTTVMEYVYLGLHVWSFSQAIDPLVGIWIYGAPIEEFVFWYGAAGLFIFMYLGFEKAMSKGKGQL